MKKFLKCIGFILLILVILFCINFIRNYVIISKMINLANENFVGLDNYHLLCCINSNDNDFKSMYSNYYYKDGILKIKTDWAFDKYSTSWYNTNTNEIIEIDINGNRTERKEEVIISDIGIERYLLEIDAKSIYVLENMFRIIDENEYTYTFKRNEIYYFVNKETGLIDKAIDEDARGADYAFTLEIGNVTDCDISRP